MLAVNKYGAKACSLVKENIFMFTKETQLLHIEYFAVFTSIISTLSKTAATGAKAVIFKLLEQYSDS